MVGHALALGQHAPQYAVVERSPRRRLVHIAAQCEGRGHAAAQGPSDELAPLIVLIFLIDFDHDRNVVAVDRDLQVGFVTQQRAWSAAQQVGDHVIDALERGDGMHGDPRIHLHEGLVEIDRSATLIRRADFRNERSRRRCARRSTDTQRRHPGCRHPDASVSVWHGMHPMADGSAARRSDAIGSPQLTHRP